MNALSYLFWPNPGAVAYSDSRPLAALALCGVLLFLSLTLRILRTRAHAGPLRRFAQSFNRVALWFGVTGLFLVVARVEGMQYLTMRFWWVVWGGSLLLCSVVRFRRLRLLGYDVISSPTPPDPREKYLPRRKHPR